jgi:hypothetical protein
MAEPDNGNDMFSDETLIAIRSAINDDNFGPLEGIFREDNRFMRELQMKFGIANASDMARTRMVLNMMMANNPPMHGYCVDRCSFYFFL